MGRPVKGRCWPAGEPPALGWWEEVTCWTLQPQVVWEPVRPLGPGTVPSPCKQGPGGEGRERVPCTLAQDPLPGAGDFLPDPCGSISLQRTRYSLALIFHVLSILQINRMEEVPHLTL